MNFVLGVLIGLSTAHAEETNTWHLPENKAPVAYAVMIHGFNLRPSKMDELAQLFKQNGVAVLRVALTGHEDKPNEMQKVSADIWAKDFERAFEEVKTKANGAPIYLVGFSLGGLLSTHEWTRLKINEVTGAILFAPAILTNNTSSWILNIPLPIFPSLSREGWISHRWTSRKGYEALFQLQQTVQGTNKPTLVFLREEDEFVDFQKTKQWIDGNRLNTWKVISLPRKEDLSWRDRFLDHLMITRETAGEAAWKQIEQEVDLFLKQTLELK